MSSSYEEIIVKAPPGSLGLKVTPNFIGAHGPKQPSHGFRVKDDVAKDSNCFGKVFKDDVITHIDGKGVVGLQTSDFKTLLKNKVNAHKIITILRMTSGGDKKLSVASSVVKGKPEAKDNVMPHIGNLHGKAAVEITMQKGTSNSGDKAIGLGNALSSQATKDLGITGIRGSITKQSGIETVSGGNGEGRKTSIEKNDSRSNNSNPNGVDKSSTSSHQDLGGKGEKDSNEGNEKTSRKGNGEMPKKVSKVERRASLTNPDALCDICNKPDGYGGMNMQQCWKCGVYIHEDCYGLVNEKKGKKYSYWTCHACSVVGKEIVVSKKDEELKKVAIKSRSKRCALCSISSGNHAMHPLYNISGPEGRPIVYKKRGVEDGIVWVHTLCAMFITCYENTKGMIYGCYEDGSYENEDGILASVDEEGDDEKIIDLDFRKKPGSPVLLTPVHHHMVIENQDVDAIGKIEEFRELKCTVCKKQDSNARRIPVQCAVEECHRAFHVGCARWGDKGEGRIRFFPGNIDLDVVALGYCKSHSKMKQEKQNRKRKEKYEKEASDDEDFDNEIVENIDEENLFDDDVDEGNERREVFVKRKKVKRQRVSDLNRNQNSAYFEKKRIIEKTAGDILSDYTKELQSGHPFERVRKRVNAHWRQTLSKTILRAAFERIEIDLRELEDEYSQKKPTVRLKDRQETRIKARSSRDAIGQMGRWGSLFDPNKVGGISKEWDTYEEVSESDFEREKLKMKQL